MFFSPPNRSDPIRHRHQYSSLDPPIRPEARRRIGKSDEPNRKANKYDQLRKSSTAVRAQPAEMSLHLIERGAAESAGQ